MKGFRIKSFPVYYQTHECGGEVQTLHDHPRWESLVINITAAESQPLFEKRVATGFWSSDTKLQL